MAAHAPNARARRGDRGGRLVGRRARGERDDAFGPAGVGRDELVARAALAADPDRHAQRQAQLAHADRELRALGDAAQLEHRLVAKRGQSFRHRRCRLGCGQELLERHAVGLVGQEAVVRRVLQQPPHEVGHPRDEIADGAVGAHAQPVRRERVAEVVAEAAQHLELDVAGARRRACRLRAIACETERRLCEAIATRTSGRASSSRAVSASKFASQSALRSKTGTLQPCWRASTTSWSQ